MEDGCLVGGLVLVDLFERADEDGMHKTRGEEKAIRGELGWILSKLLQEPIGKEHPRN